MLPTTTSTTFAVSPVDRAREPLPEECCRDAIQGSLGRAVEAVSDYRGQLVASIRSHPLLATLHAGFEAEMGVDNRIEDGYIVLGDSPGIGLVLDEEKLAPFEVEGPSLVGGRPLRGRRRGAGLFEVGPDEPDEVGQE